MAFRRLMLRVFDELGPDSITIRYHRYTIYQWMGRRLFGRAP